MTHGLGMFLHAGMRILLVITVFSAMASLAWARAPVAGPFEAGRFAAANEIDKLVHAEGVPPAEIVVLAPFLPDNVEEIDDAPR